MSKKPIKADAVDANGIPKIKKVKITEFYVKPKEFKDAIQNYYDTGKGENYLGDCLNKIANRLSYYPSFINYSYKDEMIGDAIVKMYSALIRKKYDMLNGSNPFSYFTTIAINAFINRIKKEKKHHDTLTRFRESKYEEYITSGNSNIYIKPINNDYSENSDDV